MNPHPMQQIVRTDSGTIRFRENKIVRFLLDAGSIDLNQLAAMGGVFSQEDWMQLAQLIGYSVSGYGDLSYASRKSVQEADILAEELIKNPRLKQVPKRRR